ncbi:hypothetical protein WR25_09686 [Diploscapter pachys]|uniref:Phosphatidic acid phosphatase type 2/haloperoxidase domain-containing protein n=1 Tax=Diploscapter pachys TaxID=2018661 RepID=A0A2A2K801_9BILA|nr:hypothetical protein WR25_09686 [Diploscapter pachys]
MVSLRLQRATFSGRFNRPNESDNRRRIVFKGLLYMFLDITIALGVALLLYLMFVGRGISPSPRPLYCNDTGIAKPFYPNTVDLKQLLLISLATPFLVICTVEALLFYNAEGNHRLAKFFTTSTLVYLQYVIVYAVGTFAMEIIKCRVGRLRPHFLAACRPDWSKMDCKTDPNSVIPPEEVICLNPDVRRIRTARASFPSGHTAAAALCWLFMSIYLIRMASATRNRYVIWMRNVLITTFTIWTFFVAVTRVTDYWHHPTDVLGSSFRDSKETSGSEFHTPLVEMNLQEAKAKFIELLDNVDPTKKSAFLHYVTTFSDVKRSKLAIDAEEKLQRISDSLREQLPTSAILDSENVLYPQVGFDSEHNSQNTVNVDCFLYNDDAVEDLISHGKMSRNYCLDCGSKNTKPLLFISHSLSVPQIEFIFTKLIPLDKDSLPADFHVLDIGSRIGSVVFGAALFRFPLHHFIRFRNVYSGKLDKFFTSSNF